MTTLEKAARAILCKVCGLMKPTTEFSKQAGSKTGYQLLCKPCKNEASRAAYAQIPWVVADRERREQERLTNIKDWARRRVITALRQGMLTRPDACEKCGCANKPTKAGHSYIQAHHHRGYENELDVVWLCASCHALEERRWRGSANPKATQTTIQRVRLPRKPWLRYAEPACALLA